MKENLQHLLRLLEEVRDAQKECRHGHHSHTISQSWQADDIIRGLLHDIEVSESEQVIHGKAAVA